MHIFGTTVALVAIVGLAAAGHLHHGHHDFGHEGGHSEEVSYSVATKHEHGGHGGGHDAGHQTQHEWSYESGHDAGNFGGHDEGHYGGHEDGGHDGSHDDGGHDHHAYPKYEFDYGVKDTKTGDIKGHSESRDGDKVKGQYTLKEADGTTRVVEYSSDKKGGFKATVHKIGHAHADHGSHGSHDHGHHGHGEASSYVVVKKHEEKKH